MVNPNYAAGRVQTGARAVEIDEGLRAYMNKVYALMAGAMVITGLVAWVIGHDFREAIVASQGGSAAPYLFGPETIALLYGSPLKWAIMFAPLIFIFAFAAMINRMSASAAQMVFWAFGAVMGLSMAWIFAVFTGESIARTFFITAIAFGGLSIWGYTTKKDLSGWGSFLIMGVIGLIVASIVNIFLASSGLQWAISLIGVLLFSALTAYDTQSIKNEYLQMRTVPGGEAWLEKGAIMGALRLYLDFINMFMFLLQFLGNRE